MASSKQQSVNFSLLKIKELKNFLRDHGEYVSGSKEELVLRAQGVRMLGKQTIEEVQLENLTVTERRRAERLVSPLGEVLPDPSLLNGWSDDIELLPSFSNSDLYNYIVLNKQRTLDMGPNNAKRQLKAKVFYEDRHVHSIQYHPIFEDCSHCYVKAKVIPSLPTKETTQKPDYNVWTSLSKVTGHVHAAGCNCSAGEGESCNHIAAIMYALVDITEKKAEGLHASTSSGCKWNRPRKRKLSPIKSQDICFKKHKFEDTKRRSTSEVNRVIDVSGVQPVDLVQFAEKLQECAPHAGWLQTQASVVSKAETECDIALPLLHSINFQYSDNTDLNSKECVDQFEHHFENLSISEQECTYIEWNTRGQANNPLWSSAKEGRLTASNFGLICKRKSSTHPESAIKQVLGYSSFDNACVKWGREHEAAARRKYEILLRREHPDAKVSKCGLFVTKQYPHLGASPDGLVHIGNEMGVLEIKCPYKWRRATVNEASKDPQFYCSLQSDIVKLKENHSHYYQIQGQMAISQTKWCDYILWTLVDFHVERIHFKQQFWEHCVWALNDFYLKAILPELYTERVKRGKTVKH